MRAIPPARLPGGEQADREEKSVTRSLGVFVPHPHKHINPHAAVDAKLTFQDRLALMITGAVGTMYAVYVFGIFMAAWMLFQVASGQSAFDPFPFAFLLFMGNIVQLLLMPLIMVGQNLQGKHSEARAEEEYKTVGKTFADLETVMRHLDAQDRELLRQSGLLIALIETLVPAQQREAILARFPENGNGGSAGSGSASDAPDGPGGSPASRPAPSA
jgi:uncharacterized membrane protein